MQNQEWERVDEDSPLRCQAVISSRGQCINRRVDGSEYCPAHGGNHGAKRARKAARRMYDVERFKAKLETFAEHEGIKSLRDEIAVLRMLLEVRLQACHDHHELLLHSQSLSNLVANIEKLVVSCNRLDTQLGDMMDSTQAIAWMNEIVEIIHRHVPGDEVLNEISEEILESYQEIKSGRVASRKLGNAD